MTMEELQAALEKATGDIDALKAVNKQLKDEKTEATRLAREAEEAREEAASEAAAKSGDLETVKAALEKQHAKAISGLQAQLEGANSRLSGLLIDGEITKALVENKIPAHQHRALTLELKDGAKIEGGVAMRGDQKLADYLPAFFTSDAGKAWVPQPVNIGTGSPGVSVSNAHGYTKDTWTLTEASKVAKENPEQAKAIDASMGGPLGL